MMILSSKAGASIIGTLCHSLGSIIGTSQSDVECCKSNAELDGKSAV